MIFAEENPSANVSEKSFSDTELKLTRLFVEHRMEMYEKGYVKRKEMERFIPSRKIDPIGFSDSLLNKKQKDSKYSEDINDPYRKLKESLAQYLAISKAGGWPAVTS